MWESVHKCVSQSWKQHACFLKFQFVFILLLFTDWAPSSSPFDLWPWQMLPIPAGRSVSISGSQGSWCEFWQAATTSSCCEFALKGIWLLASIKSKKKERKRKIEKGQFWTGCLLVDKTSQVKDKSLKLCSSLNNVVTSSYVVEMSTFPHMPRRLRKSLKIPKNFQSQRSAL